MQFLCTDISSGKGDPDAEVMNRLVNEAKANDQKILHFKGYIHDVGGPTANFRHTACDKAERNMESVPNKQCLFPKPCQNLKVAIHKDYLMRY